MPDFYHLFNIIDWLTILGIICSTIIGLWRGLLKEMLSVLSWGGSIWFSLTYCQECSIYLTFITLSELKQIIAFTLLLLCSLALSGIISHIILKILHITVLHGMDKVLGVCFGFARGVAMSSLLVYFASHTYIIDKPWLQNSILVPEFYQVATFSKPMVEYYLAHIIS